MATDDPVFQSIQACYASAAGRGKSDTPTSFPRLAQLILPCVFYAIGCAPSVRVQSTALVTGLAPRPEDHPIQLYGSALPECPYEEVALVSARGKRSASSQLLDAVRDQARKMGGDAVLGLSQDTDISGAVPVGAIIVPVKRLVISGTVIRFRDPHCMK